MKRKNKNIIYKLFILLFLLFNISGNSLFLHAGNPQEEYHNNKIEIHSFNKDSLDFYKKNLKYPDLEKEKDEEENSEENNNFENISLDGIWVTLAKLLFFLLLALLIGAIIYKVSDSNRPGARTKKSIRQNREIELEEIKENLHETDLPKLIKQAAHSEDYQHAVSLYYLEVLKRLSKKNLIVWKKAKTNAEYLRELSGLSIEPQFRKITHIFESVFYGEQEITTARFQAIESLFKDMLDTIDKTQLPNE